MSIPTLSLEGQVAIVTGSRMGLGKAIALAFAEAGADVALCDIIVEDGMLEAVAEEIKKLGRRSIAVRTDVTKKAQVDNLVRRVEDELGPIDILVNNAGGIHKKSRGLFFNELSEEDWDDAFAMNFKGCLLCTQAVSKGMMERKKGNIINISSIGGQLGPVNAFGCAKASQDRFTRGAALDLAKYNIRVNGIEPGWTATETYLSFVDPERLKWCANLTPLGKIGEMEDVAACALFLASDASKSITGINIRIDNGFLLGFMEHVDYVRR